MNQGRIEQLGTPFEIYKSPASEFVASFVGQLNLIPVKLVDRSERLVAVDGRTVQAGRIAEKFSAEKPRLAVRPEELKSGHAPGQNNLQGKVESIHYLGSIIRVRVDVHGSLLAMDLFNEWNLSIPNVGDTCDVHFPIDACWLI
jgi:putative spermidine/putrescine transport system ATP-binding protein